MSKQLIKVSESSAEVLLALESFVYDNPALETLEAILDDFNPFAAMGWVRQEVRHSAFLRWLFDPSETHGLGSYALRVFLKKVARRVGEDGDCRPTVFDINRFAFSNAQVQAEWESIDLLVTDEESRILLLIENKIDSGEHSKQLQRYRKLVEERFPDYKKIFVFLTIEGSQPTDEAYIPISYEVIVESIGALLERCKNQLAEDVAVFMEHYLEMLRRNIVEDSQVQKISREIYQTHKRALDVLFEHRPDKELEVSECLSEMLKSRVDVEFDRASKTSVRFIPKALDFLPKVGAGGKSSDNRILLFDISNYASKLILYVNVFQGDEAVRGILRDIVDQNADIFNRANTTMGPSQWAIHRINWLGKKKYEDLSVDEIRDAVNAKLDELMESELPNMVLAFKNAKF